MNRNYSVIEKCGTYGSRWDQGEVPKSFTSNSRYFSDPLKALRAPLLQNWRRPWSASSCSR